MSSAVLDKIANDIDKAKAQSTLRDIVIQPCPALLTDLRTEFNRADPDPQVIARIAERDVAMAASLIRVANSPLYQRSRAAATVAEAVSVLGMNSTISILTGFLLRQSFPVKWDLLNHFWENSTRRADAMGFIAKQMYGIKVDIAHSCGLFCHVGIPILLQAVPGYEKTLQQALASPEKPMLELENAAHRTDHAVVGAIVAKTWRLPPIVSIAVRMHHDLQVLQANDFPVELRTLVAMLGLADHLVNRFEGSACSHEWELHGEQCLAQLHVGAVEVDHWQDALQDQFAGIVGS
ncbi:HDOD domain-containing protein [Curvibacter sp. CHRR-16]|uniref:HDOD domain-containing protein n=1 Tax=Curvibacter sp. CHRR-16 TaxID=2835872 RepID=UPI001BDB6B8A|nr:HDOD domain-containing protein [Curvibacter sp. CHRR-16]MBT0568894.1 HDOD domain-containing protein [Curvibacter sp. CHRR-16]